MSRRSSRVSQLEEAAAKEAERAASAKAAAAAASASQVASQMEVSSDDEVTLEQLLDEDGDGTLRGKKKRYGSLTEAEKRLRATLKQNLATRPIYLSEEEGQEDADAEMTDRDASAAAASSPAAAACPSSSSPLSCRTLLPRLSLTERLYSRSLTSAPPIKQWSLHLAAGTGRIATAAERKRKKTWTWEEEKEGVQGKAVQQAGEQKADEDVKMEDAEEGKGSEAQAAAASIAAHSTTAEPAVKNRPHVPADYIRPFHRADVRPAAAGATASSSSASGAQSTTDAEGGSHYRAMHVAKIVGTDRGYSITDHSWYTDKPPQRLSPSLLPEELAALTPIPPGEACRRNGLTLIRQMRVKVKSETRAEISRIMKTVTGEYDRRVLSMCESGSINKCRVYQTDDFNFSLLTTDRVLSGEPLCAWMGTLREKNTFSQRLGFESSLIHIWAYNIRAHEMPPGYDGPDLVVDASEYGNESHFLRDPKWSHQQADANVGVRLVWHQRMGLPYLVFVALSEIAPNAELFVDWSNDCWKIVWRTQLTALALNSHLQHRYLASLQAQCVAAGINVLPQYAGSKFAAARKSVAEEKAQQKLFLDEELSPFRTTSATTLEKKAPTPPAATPPPPAELVIRGESGTPSAMLASSPTPDGVPTKDAFSGVIAGSRAERLKLRSLKVATDAASLTPSPSGPDSPSTASTPSSPYTPSFNTHKAFCATSSHTMLTVFASAMLHETLFEQQRIRRRLQAHRERHYMKPHPKRKQVIAGAIHKHGLHAFQLVDDPEDAFFKSGTRLGREAKVAVSEETKVYVDEAFQCLRAKDLPKPGSKEAQLISEGTVPKAAIYEVVGLKHPARFFTRPDQTPFALIATDRYIKHEPIGAYIGVFRDFQQFHKASDSDAMQQVFAYDCQASCIPGPPNPYLSSEEKALPEDQQLAYRGDDLIVESLYYGNEIRFMNDAYGRSGGDGTVNAYATIMWDRERHWPVILIKAHYTIPKGEEIICDYGEAFWNKVARSLMMDHASYGDEVKALIEETERWIVAHGLTLPIRPTKRTDLPALFTADARKSEVHYPLHFLSDFDPQHDPTVTQEEAVRALEEGKAKVEAWRVKETQREVKRRRRGRR